MKTCPHCNKEFENHSLYANHVRWHHKDDDFYKESNNNIKIGINKYHGEIEIFKTECHRCGNEMEVECRPKQFNNKNYYCSEKCRNRPQTEETKKKLSAIVSEQMIRQWKDPIYSEKMIKIMTSSGRFVSKGEKELRGMLKERYGEKEVMGCRKVDLSDKDIKCVDVLFRNRNIIVEYDGPFHFKQIYSGDKFEDTVRKDKLLNIYCIENDIKLIRVKDELFRKDKNKIFEEIIDIIDNKDIGNYFIY